MLATPSSRFPWPLPALLAWVASWAVFHAAATWSTPLAFVAATLAGALCALAAGSRWRRAIGAAGFPLSALALGALGAMPAWGWLAAALPLALAYPLRAWRDAPFFPTPAHALEGLERCVVLPAGARVLDAGCGLGHGLHALRRAFPAACLEGIEWSRPLAWVAALRCPFASVRCGDMWARPWQGVALVYLFQRPESMARAVDKARREMPGGWLVSLEFEAPGLEPAARLGARGLWVYRISGSTDRDARR